jgi:hypothetical protein
MCLTDKEKSIYNSYLIASRTIKKKPFKLRNDFTTIDNQTYTSLKKLGIFFDKNSNIKQIDFFTAPYAYYGVDNYFELHYFLTSKALKCYTLYQRKKETENPDSDHVINNCKECCSFIYKFCKSQGITLHEYKSILNGTTPQILQHLREHKINFYILHGLDCGKTLNQVEPELLNFFISNFQELLNDTRINFQRSTRLKGVIREALSIIEKQLLKNKITILE